MSVSIFEPVRALFKRRVREVIRPVAAPYTGDDTRVLRCHISYNKHGGYCIPESSYHRGAVQSILAGNVWEPDTIDFIVKYGGGAVTLSTPVRISEISSQRCPVRV